MIMEYTFNLYNSLASNGVVIALKKLICESKAPPVVICVGSDLSVGDSLGPVTGTKLKEKLKDLNVFIYGTLSKPITAHEIKYTQDFIRRTHPDSPVIAIDAAVGVAGDIGLIKIAKRSLKPGSGANKKLAKLGDISIMGIVAEKSLFNYALFSSTRLNMVYRMAEIIAEGVANFILDSLQSLTLWQNADKILCSNY